MTDRLDEIRKRLEAATPGPWFYRNAGVRKKCKKAEIKLADCPVAFRGPDIEEHKGGYNDAEFIAHAPEDIAYLLAEVERLNALVGGLDRTEAQHAPERPRIAQDARK